MMLLHLYCPTCFKELIERGQENDFESLPPLYSDVYEVLDKGIYKTQCPKGHKGTIVVNNLKFELLFDLGLNAIIDGYYREAVASITSAMERFYEFFIKVSWRIAKVEYENIEKSWKLIANQSERQLGAYISSYSNLFCEHPLVMKNNMTSFRNSVVHKGEIPDKDKTIEYVQYVLNLIDSSLDKLKSAYPDIVHEVYEHYLPQYNTTKDEDVLTINNLTTLTIQPLVDDDIRKNREIKSLLEMIKNDRHQLRTRLYEKGTFNAEQE